jgi:DNA polymerase III delta subunit
MLKILVGKKNKGGAEELKWEGMSAEEIATLASTPDMFGGSRTFVLVGALYSDRGEEFLELAGGLSESPHVFVFEEEKLLKHETDVLTKAGAKIEKAEKVLDGESKKGFDPYGLTSALAAKDRKKLWLGLTAALRDGDKPEAIAGLLSWKARQMKNVKLSRELLVLYHDSHRGAGDLELLLEKFALTL